MRPVRRTAIAILLVLAFHVAPATGQWRENGKVVPDTDWRKSSGEFGAMLMLTDDPETFFEQWNKPPSPDYKPEITTTSASHRGGRVSALVLFIGCKADAKGNCNVETDFTLRRPDGSVYGEHKNVETWKGKAAPAEPFLQLGLGVFGLKVEDDDPLGTYLFEATVHDRNAKADLALKLPLTVAAQPASGKESPK